MKNYSFLKGVAAAALIGISASAASAQEIIRAVTFTPAQVSFSKNFMKFVDLVNERGEGVVQIQVIGGPEVIPNERMGEAQMNGIADMFLLPAGLYLNIVPEGEAFAGSNKDPMTVREEGGLLLAAHRGGFPAGAVLEPAQRARRDGGAPRRAGALRGGVYGDFGLV